MLDLVRNPEDLFSGVAAHLKMGDHQQQMSYRDWLSVQNNDGPNIFTTGTRDGI